MPKKSVDLAGKTRGAERKPRLVPSAPKGLPVVYQLKIVLKDVKPAIWRRFQVAGDISFARLSSIIQIVMGWQDAHLHEFSIGRLCIGVPDPDEPPLGPELTDEETVRLNEVIKDEKVKFAYDYDFGDGWRHELTVEKVLPWEKGAGPPCCLAGKRCCPPEDCGGPWGYKDLLKAIGDPAHPEHGEIMDWLGGDFDPEEFDLESINQALGVLG